MEAPAHLHTLAGPLRSQETAGDVHVTASACQRRAPSMQSRRCRRLCCVASTRPSCVRRGLRLPSQGLDTPKLNAWDLLTLTKLLPVALLREPQAQVQMSSLLLLLGWLLTCDQAIHTDDTLARLRDDRVKRGPRSLFHGMRSVAARWGRHVSASRVAMGWGGVATARMVLQHTSSSHIPTPCGAPCRVRCVDACHLRDAHDSRGGRCRWRARRDWRWAAQW